MAVVMAVYERVCLGKVLNTDLLWVAIRGTAERRNSRLACVIDLNGPRGFLVAGVNGLVEFVGASE